MITRLRWRSSDEVDLFEAVIVSERTRSRTPQQPASPQVLWSTAPSVLSSCMTDRDSIFHILQEVGEYFAQTEDLKSLDEVFCGIDDIIDASTFG